MGCTKSKPQAPSGAAAATKTKEAAAADFVQVASERALDVPPPVPEQSAKPAQPPPLPFANKKPAAEEAVAVVAAVAPPPLPFKPTHLKPEEQAAVVETEEAEVAAPAKTYEEVAEEEADETPVEVEEEHAVSPSALVAEVEVAEEHEEEVEVGKQGELEVAVGKQGELEVAEEHEEVVEPQVIVYHSEEVIVEAAAAVVVVEEVVTVEPVPVAAEEQVDPQAPLTMGQKLHRENAVIYPSASAALASKGLQKYAPDLEKRGIVSYKDLTTFEEDLSDPFWSKMPPYPDRKKMNALLEDARIAFGIEEGGVAPAPVAADVAESAAPAVEDDEDDDEPEYVPVREKTEAPCDAYDVDVYAKEFATCTCGHAKMQHKQFSMDANRAPSFVMTRQASDRQAQDAAVAAPSSPRNGGVCSQFKLDLSAPSPICVTCGLAKPAHLQSSGSVADSPNRFKEMNKGSFKKPSH